jgi:LemA protein
MKVLQLLGASLIALALGGCGYNDFQRLDETVKANQARIYNVYQKRADLIPNIVATVKGEANFEQETLTKVIEARARATQVTLPDPKQATPEQMQAFVEAQKQVGSGLARLLAVSENYPNLKANAGFADLRRQLSEVETQATAARNIYIKSVRDYNVLARGFPTNLTAKMFGYEAKPQIQFEDEAAIKKTPQVKF